MDSSEIDVSAAIDEGEELTTAAQVIQKLEEVWVNEKLCPDLLPYESELVECLLDQIQHMERSLQKIKKGDFRIVFHKMELDRIRFVLNSYLRTRLEKVEKFGAYYLNQQSSGEFDVYQMSNEERDFARTYHKNAKNYLLDVMDNMPSNMQNLKMEDVAGQPQIDQSVFIKVKKESRGIMLEESSTILTPAGGDDEIVDLEKGTQHILRYKPIAHLLKNGALKLI